MNNWGRDLFNFLSKFEMYFINIFGIVIGIISYRSLGEKIEIIGSVLAATISISIARTNYKIENDKMFKDLFESFNKKYDEKFNERLNKISDKNIEVVDVELEQKEKELINDYFNFCSEQYLWYKKGRISKDVWESWRAGMFYYFNKEPIKTIYEQEMSIQANSYYGLAKEIENYRKVELLKSNFINNGIKT